MNIQTKRLIIKNWTLDDLPHYLTLSKDVGYNCFTLPGYFQIKNNDETLEKIQQRMNLFQKRGLGKLLLLKKDTSEFVGTCGMDPYLLDGKEEVELGYRICLQHWNQGYASEAAEALLDYGFQQLNLSKILAFAVPQNKQSIRIIQKLGFEYIRDFVHAELPHKLYSLANEQFQTLREVQSENGKINRFHIVTLGVTDLPKSRNFYSELFGTHPSRSSNEHISFFDLEGTKLALYSNSALAQDAEVPEEGSGFKGSSLAINVRNKLTVSEILQSARALGAEITKPAQDVFWGGYSGYFKDFDGHLWEVAWNPHFSFHLNGSLALS